MITKDALDNKLQHFHAFKCLFKAYVVIGTLENVYVVHKAIKIFIYTRHGTMNSKGEKKKSYKMSLSCLLPQTYSLM